MSAAIKRLEQVVDKQLFVKKGRGIALTSTAYQLLPQFQQAVNIIDNAISDKNHFEVCCSEILLHIMDPIKNTIFYESPPEKFLLFELLRQQKVDLVIDTVITKDAAFIIEDAYEEEAVIICRENHPPRVQGSLSKEQFYEETHCLFSGKWNNMSGFEQLSQETIQERKVDLITSSLAGMALYVAQRDCLGLVSQSFANKWSKALKLQVLQCPISICAIPYKFVYHKREMNNPAHIALREKIKANLTAAHYEPVSL
ncbi:probable transcriptional activator for leuABCD operon [Vibrio sp. JCM 18905]|nr:probable transcriptional activator for leuABCD operon [Vibrio sp. JCM 18905]